MSYVAAWLAFIDCSTNKSPVYETAQTHDTATVTCNWFNPASGRCLAYQRSEMGNYPKSSHNEKRTDRRDRADSVCICDLNVRSNKHIRSTNKNSACRIRIQRHRCGICPSSIGSKVSAPNYFKNLVGVVARELSKYCRYVNTVNKLQQNRLISLRQPNVANFTINNLCNSKFWPGSMNKKYCAVIGRMRTLAWSCSPDSWISNEKSNGNEMMLGEVLCPGILSLIWTNTTHYSSQVQGKPQQIWWRKWSFLT